ncbi:MAG: hypothetical protein P1U40_00120 [Coxiellaceae bacterium]|nr:hypothetical protein [Coxiellaceae bacterium]
MRNFSLFQRIDFLKQSPSTKPIIEIELVTPSPSAIPDGNYFAFLQRSVDESINPNQAEEKSYHHTINHPDYSSYWRKTMQRLNLLPEPATKYSSGRRNAEVVMGYMTSCYDHQLNMQLLYNLNQCMEEYHVGHLDMAIHHADLFYHYIQHPEQPLPNIHWQPVALLQVTLHCKNNQIDQAQALLQQLHRHSPFFDPEDLTIYHQLQGMVESSNFNQLDEVLNELTLSDTRLEIEAYAELNLQAATKWNAFGPQKRQVIRLCNKMATNEQHPNQLVDNPLKFERQLIQITKKNNHLGNLLVALYYYQLFTYYDEEQKTKLEKGEYDETCDKACQLFLRQAIESLTLARDAQETCHTATSNDMNFCHRDRNGFYFKDKQLEKLKKCCMFKFEGDIATMIKKLEDLHQQQLNVADLATTTMTDTRQQQP